MQIIKYNLIDIQKFHFGNDRETLELLPSSQTFFGAFVGNAAMLYGDNKVEEIYSRVDNDTLMFSSVLLGLDIKSLDSIKKTVYFIPKPMGISMELNKKNEEAKKQLHFNKTFKQVKYISLDLLLYLENNYDKEVNTHEIVFLGCDLACRKEEMKDCYQLPVFIHKKAKMRNRLHRRNRIETYYENGDKESTVFFEEEAYISSKKYSNGIHIKPYLYVLIDGKLSIEDEAVLRMIADQGLGGKRSIGYGQLHSCEIKPLDNEEKWKGIFNRETDGYLNLGDLIPSQEEVHLLEHYEVKNKGGYGEKLGIGISKPKYRVIGEGSIIGGRVGGCSRRECVGKNEFYINGKTIIMPSKLGRWAND